MLVWWNGRRVGLKIRCTRVHVGSSPTTSTNPALRNGIFFVVVVQAPAFHHGGILRYASWRSFALLTRLRADASDSKSDVREYMWVTGLIFAKGQVYDFCNPYSVTLFLTSPTTSTNPVLRNGIFLMWWCRRLLSTTVEYVATLRGVRSLCSLG